VQYDTVHIVETVQDLDTLSAHLTTDTSIMDIVCVDADKHSCNNKISLLFFYFMKSKNLHCLPIHHNEATIIAESVDRIKDSLKMSIGTKYVFDKKSALQLFGGDYDFVDIRLMKYMSDGTIDTTDNGTNAHLFIKNNFRDEADINACVPIYKHGRAFMNKIKDFTPNADMLKEDGFKFVNDVMTARFAKLESVGLCVSEDFTEVFDNDQTKHVNNGFVYTQYNLLTSTGRPSNRFAGVNYAALNKNDESRTCFVSRHGEDGMLVMMDYNAFHPRLIAHLVNFNMEAGENPYAYLAKYYFNKQKLEEEDIAAAKQYTFTQIYGGFEKKWLHIPYFAKIQEYIDHRWKFFNENGYIETPKYKRKIKECHIPDANPNKLFNYILQAFETEMAVDVLGDLLGDLNGKKTVPILYTYDSILFDAHKEDKMDTIKRLKSIMERGKFPVKVYVGKNYKNMKQVNL
jgi:hypothetical protein